MGILCFFNDKIVKNKIDKYVKYYVPYERGIFSDSYVSFLKVKKEHIDYAQMQLYKIHNVKDVKVCCMGVGFNAKMLYAYDIYKMDLNGMIELKRKYPNKNVECEFEKLCKEWNSVQCVIGNTEEIINFEDEYLKYKLIVN